jgi:hypothetical protein
VLGLFWACANQREVCVVQEVRDIDSEIDVVNPQFNGS